MTAYNKIKKQLKELYKQQRLRKDSGDIVALTEMERELNKQVERTLELISFNSKYLSLEEKLIVSDHYIHGLSWPEVCRKRNYTHDGLMSLNRRIIQKISSKKSTH